MYLGNTFVCSWFICAAVVGLVSSSVNFNLLSTASDYLRRCLKTFTRCVNGLKRESG